MDNYRSFQQAQGIVGGADLGPQGQPAPALSPRRQPGPDGSGRRGYGGEPEPR